MLKEEFYPMPVSHVDDTEFTETSPLEYKLLHLVRSQVRVKGPDKGTAVCRQAWLAQKMGVTRKTVNRALARLMELGIISLETAEGRAGTVIYCDRHGATPNPQMSRRKAEDVPTLRSSLPTIKEEKKVEGRSICGAAIAEAATDELNRLTDSSYAATGKATIRLAARLEREGYTPTQARSVVAAKVAEWKGDRRMSRYLRPATLLAFANFSAYVEDLESKPAHPATAWQPATNIIADGYGGQR